MDSRCTILHEVLDFVFVSFAICVGAFGYRIRFSRIKTREAAISVREPHLPDLQTTSRLHADHRLSPWTQTSDPTSVVADNSAHGSGGEDGGGGVGEDEEDSGGVGKMSEWRWCSYN